MLVGKNNGSNIPQTLNLSWTTVGSVQSPGVTQRKELQVHRMVKHLNLDSMLSGFNVQLSQLMGEQVIKFILLVLFSKSCVQPELVNSCSGWDNHTPAIQKEQAKILIKFL
jgi:hypothetical protein